MIRPLPVLQLLFYAALMWLVRTGLPHASVSLPALPLLALTCALFGLSLVIAGGALFRRHDTTVNPIYPERARQLVIAGIYRFSRNPMYLGFLLMLTGWCLFMANLLNLLLLPAFVFSITQLNIKPEERALTEKFGQSYHQYMQQTRRWL